MSMKVYGLGFSTCTRKVIMTLLEKEVEDWELVPVNLMKGEHKQPEFLAKQPFGIIPLLEDGDISLFESRAISRYIAEKYPDQGTSLFGKTVKDRALVATWIEVESHSFNPSAGAIVGQKMFNPMKGLPVDEAKVAEGAEKLAKVFDIYEAELGKREYLAGDFFSLADIFHLPYGALLFAVGYGDLILSRPNVKRWWTTISSRPSWQKIQEDYNVKK